MSGLNMTVESYSMPVKIELFYWQIVLCMRTALREINISISKLLPVTEQARAFCDILYRGAVTKRRVCGGLISEMFSAQPLLANPVLAITKPFHARQKKAPESVRALYF